MKRRRLIIVLVVGSAALLLTAFVALLVIDELPSDRSAATADATRIERRATPVTGIVIGATADLMSPWSAVLDVQAGDGRIMQLVINAHTKLRVAPSVPGLADAEPGDPFPYAIVGTLVDASAQSVRVGLLKTGRALVASAAIVEQVPDSFVVYFRDGIPSARLEAARAAVKSTGGISAVSVLTKEQSLSRLSAARSDWVIGQLEGPGVGQALEIRLTHPNDIHAIRAALSAIESGPAGGELDREATPPGGWSQPQ